MIVYNNDVMKLEKLLENIEYTLLSGDINQEVSQIDYDSRKVVNNSLFVCITGSVVDGHKFIDSVIDQGAKVIVVTKDVDVKEGITYIKVENARKTLAQLSCNYFDHPSKKMTVIGLTGTKGKTTISYMIYNILSLANQKAGLIGTAGSIVNGVHKETRNTTPESFELQKLMNEMVEAGCQYCVMEVSSQGLMLDRVYGIDFDIGVFTNLSRDHISPTEHKDFDDYMNCKKKLFNMCKIGFFNQDDLHYKDMTNNVSCDIVTYGLNQGDLKAWNTQLYKEKGKLGISFDTTGMIEDHFDVDIPGNFSVYNALVSILISHHLHIPIDTIKDALKKVYVKGRVEIVPYSDDFTVIIDYAHNQLSMESIIDTMLAYHPSRITCIFGSPGKRDISRRVDVGKVFGQKHVHAILTEDDSRGEDVTSICEMIADAMKEYSDDYMIIENRKEAIIYALDHAIKNEIILCLGKGHETHMVGKNEEWTYFSEREIIETHKKEKKS